MIAWAQKNTLVAGIAVILLTNTMALLGVVYNRSGDPESQLTMTNRELRKPFQFHDEKDNSGLVLQLIWRVLPPEGRNDYGHDYGSYSVAEWMTGKKLESLGFDVSVPVNDVGGIGSNQRRLPQDVFLVLEQDGKTYQTALRRAQQAYQRASAGSDKQKMVDAEKRLIRERDSNSRLFVVDAGRDVAELRTLYPDQRRYAIVRGSIRVQWSTYNKVQSHWEGYINDVANESVNVPLEFQSLMKAMSRGRLAGLQDQDFSPFSMKLAFGKRLEPWVEFVKAGSD